MIDTVKPYYYITDLLRDRLLDAKALTRDGIKLYGNVFYLKHPFGYKNPKVWFNLEERELCIETSVPKLLQGHNVFGSNRVEYLCLALVELIYEQIGLTFSSRERRIVRAKRIRLGRLDTTGSFRVDSHDDVAAVVEACWEHLRAEGRKWAVEGVNDFGSTYHRKHSKRVADKFYGKYDELLATGHRIPASVVERDLILEYALNLVRFEVTWRAPELRRLGLEYADEWTPEIVREKVMERLDRLNFQGQIKQRLAPKRLNGLNQGARAFYDIWAQGSNLRPHRNYSPLKRARQMLLKHGVDIFRRSETGSDIALNELLIEENAYFVAPKAERVNDFETPGCINLVSKDCVFS